MTPLHYAILKRQPKMALALIDEGADMNATDSFGNRPLHLAAMRGCQEVMDGFPDKLEEHRIKETAEINQHFIVENAFDDDDFSEKHLKVSI